MKTEVCRNEHCLWRAMKNLSHFTNSSVEIEKHDKSIPSNTVSGVGAQTGGKGLGAL